VALALSSACVAPSAPATVIGLGTYRSAISASSPVSYYYDGTAGERLNVAVAVENTSVGNAGSIKITTSAGATVDSAEVDGYNLDHPVLPTTGRYTITIRTSPSNLLAQQSTLTLSHDEFRGPVPLGVQLPVLAQGQTLTYSYAGTAGEKLDVIAVEVIAPDSTVLVAVTDGEETGRVTLPVTGTYTVVQPYSNPAAVSHDLTGGPLSIGATPIPPLAPGQHVYFTYSGTAGEVIDLGLVYNNALVLDPAGNLIDSVSTQRVRLTLPTTGQYTVIVLDGVGSVYLTHDYDGGVLSVGDTAGPTLLFGQALAYDYSGTAGETLQISVDYHESGPGPAEHLTDPDGDPVPADLIQSGDTLEATYTLPVTGTYHLLIATDQPDPALVIHVTSS
jgi:hypothetical protein